jgi:hypothetical protein
MRSDIILRKEVSMRLTFNKKVAYGDTHKKGASARHAWLCRELMVLATLLETPPSHKRKTELAITLVRLSDLSLKLGGEAFSSAYVTVSTLENCRIESDMYGVEKFSLRYPCGIVLFSLVRDLPLLKSPVIIFTAAHQHAMEQYTKNPDHVLIDQIIRTTIVQMKLITSIMNATVHEIGAKACEALVKNAHKTEFVNILNRREAN